MKEEQTNKQKGKRNCFVFFLFSAPLREGCYGSLPDDATVVVAFCFAAALILLVWWCVAIDITTGRL